jgi:hypothetical protein
MARYENIQALFDLLWRTRDAQSMDALCGALSVSRATVRRLITFLRDQRGLDVRYDREQNGYRLHRAPKDAAAAALLGVSGDDRIHLHLNHLRQLDSRLLGTVLTALRSRKRLQFGYHSRSSDETQQRHCSPLRLTFYRNNWYLAAWCHLRDALRVFSLDRMQQAKVLRESAHEPPAAQWAPQLDSGYGIFAGQARYTASLRFTPLAARWVAEEQWHPQASRQLLPDGSVLLELPYADDTELLREILRHGPDCEVLGPPALREAVIALIRRMHALY